MLFYQRSDFLMVSWSMPFKCNITLRKWDIAEEVNKLSINFRSLLSNVKMAQTLEVSYIRIHHEADTTNSTYFSRVVIYNMCIYMQYTTCLILDNIVMVYG